MLWLHTAWENPDITIETSGGKANLKTLHTASVNGYKERTLHCLIPKLSHRRLNQDFWRQVQFQRERSNSELDPIKPGSMILCRTINFQATGWVVAFPSVNMDVQLLLFPLSDLWLVFALGYPQYWGWFDQYTTNFTRHIWDSHGYPFKLVAWYLSAKC